MTQQSNQQQPAAPYSVDTLDVHDQRLKFSREFGTNITADVGEAFITTAAVTPDPVAQIDGRLAMLTALVNADGEAEPRGRTYLTPPWDTFTPQPLLGPGIFAGFFFARLFLMESGASDVEANIMFGPEDLVGHQPALPFGLVTLITTANFETTANITAWADGPSGPASETEIGALVTRSIYVRALMVTDNASATDIQVQISTDGRAWSDLTSSEIIDTVVRRIGLSIIEVAKGGLDWMRLYDAPEVTAITGLLPTFADGTVGLPTTGSRQYIP